MNDDVIIRAEKLTKSYRLHRKPQDRLFSLFRKGANEAGVDGVDVHHALRGIDLEVRRGEKVAIIGRNGAGKSTLLKIITRAIEPTSGKLDVRGKSHALLSLGVGFHPDFTGRENAYSFLAHMGLAGKKADSLVEEAIAFAEIEEYIDQPIKTYSTGMQARLMFAVSTALEPDLLVIDEVLGVGDAYFQNKSFERIRELCASKNATLLLVSHDIYSAAKLCPRIIWIDKGRVKGDGPSTEMVKLYENSIREQEDARQKQKLALAFKSAVRGQTVAPPAFVEVRARNNQPAATPVYFAEMSLTLNDGRALAMPILSETGAAEQRGEFGVQLMPHSAWGPVGDQDGRATRSWLNYGAVEHKAGVVIFPLGPDAAKSLEAASLEMTLRADAVVDADVVYVAPSGEEFILHRLLTEPRKWMNLSLPLGGVASSTPATGAPQASGRQGSGRAIIAGQKLLDDQGRETFTLKHGRKATFAFDVLINDATLDEKSQFILVFKRNSVDDVARVMGRSLRFRGAELRLTRVIAEFAALPLGAANYSLTVMIAKEGYFENLTGLFFSINPDVYDCRANCLEFEVVENGSPFAAGTGAVLECEWRQTAETAPAADKESGYERAANRAS